MTLLINSVLYLISFVVIWFGAGLIIKSVDRIAHRLRISSFAISFFVLGLLTSIPETAVSINSIINKIPEVFVGVFLGGTVVIFLLIIPILAILGKGIKLNHNLDKKNLLTLLGVIALPSLMVIDHKATVFDGAITIFAYAAILLIIIKKYGFIEKQQSEVFTTKVYSLLDLMKVILGIGMVFVSSQFIVTQTLAYANILDIPAYYISLIVLSIGTNLPELSIAIRAVLSGKKDIAFGDYLGSAAANALLFGVFILLSSGSIFTFNSFFITFLFVVTGLGLFFIFSQSKKDISRREGFYLLALYVSFVIYEITKELIV